MAFRVLMTLRKVFLGLTMLGLFTWHAGWLPVWSLPVLDYLIPSVALLAVLNEIAYAIYLSVYFVRVQGSVVPAGETPDDPMKTRHFEIRFQYAGMEYTFPHQDSVLSTTIGSNEQVPLMLRKGKSTMVFIDTFSLRYLYLIVSLFLLWSIYSVCKSGGI